MSTDLYITKLGGSVITDKASGEARVRGEAVRRIAQEIKRASAEKQFKLIIVLGAGPFGHVPVQKYGINNGVHTAEQKKGAEETHKSMRTLGAKVIEVFAGRDLHAEDVQKSARIRQRNKEVVEFSTAGIEKMLARENSPIPVMYGDIVPDSELGMSVISGDVIVAHLAKKLRAKRVFFGTDVDGVYGAAPHAGGNAEIIKKITNKNFGAVLKGAGGSKATDVTSGMRGKLESMKTHMRGVNAAVFNLNGANNLYLLLSGKSGIGTEIALR